MSAPKLSPDQLMQLHDGELDEALEAELLAALAEPGAADFAAQLEGLEQLGDFLREAAAHPAATSQYVSIADQVMAELDAPALKLVPEPPADENEAPPKGIPRVSPKPTEPERGWVLGVGALLAAAAAGLLWMQRPADVPQPSAAPHAQTVQEAPSAGLTGQAPAVPAEAPVAIVAVDFGANDGTIFVVGEESTPVVWLADDLPVKKTKMGPL